MSDFFANLISVRHPGQVRLPRENTVSNLAEMEPGELGWTVREAIEVDEDGFLWLDVTMGVKPESMADDVDIQVRRKDDGYEIWVPQDFEKRRQFQFYGKMLAPIVGFYLREAVRL